VGEGEEVGRSIRGVGGRGGEEGNRGRGRGVGGGVWGGGEKGEGGGAPSYKGKKEKRVSVGPAKSPQSKTWNFRKSPIH